MVDPRKVIIEEADKCQKLLDQIAKSVDKMQSMYDYLPPDSMSGQEKFKTILGNLPRSVGNVSLVVLLLGALLKTPEELRAEGYNVPDKSGPIPDQIRDTIDNLATEEEAPMTRWPRRDPMG